MATLRVMAWTAVAFAASISVCYSGPCTTDIDRMRARIDAKVEAKAGAGQAIQEGDFALMHRQPTLGSITAATEKAGDLSPRKVDAVAKGMARAVAADAARDKNGCEQALASVQSTIGSVKWRLRGREKTSGRFSRR